MARIGREEAAILYLMSRLADSDGVYRGGMLRLMKLLFLASYAKLEGGRALGLLDEPRLSLDFVIYLRGVFSRQVLNLLDLMVLRGLLEELGPRGSGARYYKLNPIASQLAREVLGEDLVRLLDEVVEAYGRLPARRLEMEVNRLLGVDDPHAKALLHGARVAALLAARREIRRLEERGLIAGE